MKHLQVRQLLRINSESLDILKKAQTILDDLENDFIDVDAYKDESLSILKGECSDAWATLSDFLDGYEEYTKEN